MLEPKQQGHWDYRMLPNKMVELVKNVGNMRQEGTGYFTDTGAEMLTVLAYLNYGETTGTTEAMREQVMTAIKQSEAKKLRRDDDEDGFFININF